MQHQTVISAIFKRMAVVFLVLCLLLCSAVGAMAAVNTDVQDAATGVVEIELVYVDPDTHNEIVIKSGSGFLVNDSTVITCNHVISLYEPEVIEVMVTLTMRDATFIMNNLQIQVSYLRDTTPIPAVTIAASEEVDFAVLSLSSQIYNRSYLTIRSSSTVETTENVYAMGFPGNLILIQDVNDYTSSDVNISSGTVSKFSVVDTVNYIMTNAVFTSGYSGGPLVDEDGCVVGICQSASGDNYDDNYYYATAIDQIINALDARGIEYESCTHHTESTSAAAESTPAPAEEETEPESESGGTVSYSVLQSLISDAQALDTSGADAAAITALQSAITAGQTAMYAETQEEVDSAAAALRTAIDAIPAPINTSALESEINAVRRMSENGSDYTEESFKTFSDALSEARSVLDDPGSQEEVDSAREKLADAAENLEEAGGVSLMLILIIIIVAVVVVVLVVVILQVTRKNRKKDDSYSDAYDYVRQSQPEPAQSQYQPFSSAPGGAGADPYGGETGVLDTGAGETTVLKTSTAETTVLSMNCGTLIRSKTGESITISSATFVIGKEQKKVNYCVRDNSSVSRKHATINYRDNVCYITDEGATNGTFVNDVRINPHEERELKDGDVILLADEEFTYHTV